MVLLLNIVSGGTIMRNIIVSLFCLGLLAGCNDVTQSQLSRQSVAEGYAVTSSARDSAAADLSASKSRASQPVDNSGIETYLAYKYQYNFELPNKAIKSTIDDHVERCINAGPSVCQILSTNISSNQNNDFVSGYLRLRAVPDWLTTYRAHLEESVSSQKGKVINNTTSVEDLTRAILDTDSRLKAKKILRERLESHLETRNAELSDLIALERELARVQGEIESATSTLNAYKKRVSMSELNVNYAGPIKAISHQSVSQLDRALKSFVRTFSNSLAVVIYFFAALIPWLLFVVFPVILVGRWLWRRLRKTSVKKIKNDKSDSATS